MPALGFTFNGRHCSEFEIIMSTKNRDLLPQSNDRYEEIPGRDGAYHIPDSLRDRILELECNIPTYTVETLRQRARQIAAWLYTRDRAELIFDDEPNIRYMAKLANQVSLEQTFSLGHFTLQFRCAPLGESVEGTIVTQEMTAISNTVTAENEGTYPTPMEITITGRTNTMNPSIRIGTKSIRYVGTLANGESIIIDTDKMTAVKGTSNVLNVVEGDWLTLIPGINTVEYTDDGAGDALVTIDFRSRWL